MAIVPVDNKRPGKLYVWGKGAYSRGNNAALTDPPSEKDATPLAHKFFAHKQVIQVRCGNNFTLVLTENREVYSFGSEDWFAGDTDSVNKPTRINAFDESITHWTQLSGRQVRQIDCGDQFAAALTEDGHVFTWGTSTHGQLGHGSLTAVSCEPKQLSELKSIVQISCGGEVMGAISRDGTLYTWGRGLCGTLGHGNETDVPTPKVVEKLEDEVIAQIKCGITHMAAITNENRLYTWGNNFLGPLGRILGKSKDSDSTPKVVDLVQTGAVVTEENLKGADEVRFIQVECLKFNTLALTDDGQVFSCGKGGADGGGHGDYPHTLFCLIEEIARKRVTALASAKVSHTGALTDNGEVFMWGNGENGALGFGNSNPLLYPEKLAALSNVFMLSCSETHSAAIVERTSDEELVEEPPVETKPAPAPVAVTPPPTQPQAAEPEPVETTTTVSNEPEPTSEVTATPEEKTEAPAPAPAPEETPAASTETTPAAEEDEAQKPKHKKANQENKPKVSQEELLKEELFGDFEYQQPTDNSGSQSPQPSQTSTSAEPAAAAAATATTGAEGELTGWLSKKGEKGIIKLWKRRWFVVDDKVIKYFDRIDAAKPKGFIVLADLVGLLPGHNGPLSFNVVTRSRRTYELQADTTEDFERWTKRIKIAIK